MASGAAVASPTAVQPRPRAHARSIRAALLPWAGTLVIAWTIGYVCNVLAGDSDLRFTRSVYLQKRAIASRFLGQRRIFLVGGSGTHYSVDATQIERDLGRPTINFGLHAGLGLNAILAALDGQVAPGDTVVLMPEYGILDADGTGWLGAAFGASIGRPTIGGWGAQQRTHEFLRAGIVTLPSFGRLIMTFAAGARGRAFDEVSTRGDAVTFLDGTASPLPSGYSVSNAALARLHAFQSSVSAAGGTLVFGLPWVLVSADDVRFADDAKTIVDRLSGIAPVLYGPHFNLQTDTSLFSDSYYHTNQRGRALRSAQLSDELAGLNLRDF
jgi:hypothetical protein